VHDIVGYGHITPKTTYGRLATIIYAVIGIPLTLLTITQLGGIMATLFRFIYKNLDTLCWQTFCRHIGACCRLSSSHRQRILLKKRQNAPLDMVASVVVDHDTNNEQTGNGLDLVKCNLQNSTVADENLNERSEMLRTTTHDDLEIETLESMGADVTRSSTKQDQSKRNCDNDSTILVGCDEKADDVMRTTACPGNSDSEVDDGIDEDAMSPEIRQLQRARWSSRLRSRILMAFADVDEVRVPAWVCLLLVVGYIVLGALVFSVWERTGDEEGMTSQSHDAHSICSKVECSLTIVT